MSTESKFKGEAFDPIRTAFAGDDVSIHLVRTFSHGTGLQIKVKTRKVGPIIFPGTDMTIADVLRSLGELAMEAGR